jgi:formate C-acetyltransferase
MLTERIECLRNNLTSVSLVAQQAEVNAYTKLIDEIYTADSEKPEVLRKADFLTAFAQRFPIAIDGDELIVGSQGFGLCTARANPIFQGNLGHIAVNYGRVLRLGITGLRAELGKRPPAKEPERVNWQAFSMALTAFSKFIERYGDLANTLAKNCESSDRKGELVHIADTCRHISYVPPVHFDQALQLVWFIQIFLHAEGQNAAFSFGRLDQYLGPYYKKDIDTGKLTESKARELIQCFYIKSCEGDESQNLIVGGIDERGVNAENELSYLCLSAMKELHVWQPSLSVRIGPTTSDAFWQEAIDLTLAGTGMPSFFNDKTVIKAIEAIGISEKRARDYAIIGCYEANPQGDTLGLTVAGQIVLPSLLLDYLNESQVPDSFDVFYSAFKTYLSKRYAQDILPQFQKRQDDIRIKYSSPFQALCLEGCIQKSRTAEEGGATYDLFGVNILGLGTLIDSLYVLQRIVFEEKSLGWTDFIQQMKAEFPNEPIFHACRKMNGKYGSDESVTNHLAKDLSEHMARMVLDHPLRDGVRPYPGFFIFTGDIYTQLPATPDGRRQGDRLSYGVGPGELCSGKTPTSILNSSSFIAHSLCACGNPLLLSFNKKDIQGEQGTQILRHLIETYFQNGGFHVHLNIIDAQTLRQAQESPDTHADLLVRISGFSARFVTLNKQLQNAIIARTEQGL